MSSNNKQVDVLWFENTNAFSEPVFDLVVLKISMKQLVMVLGGLVLAYSLAKVNLYAGIGMFAMVLFMGLVKPRVMPVEGYIVSAFRFLLNRNKRLRDRKVSRIGMLGKQRPEKAVNTIQEIRIE